MSETGVLLQGEDVAFSEIAETLQRTGPPNPGVQARALMGTMVAVGPAERLTEPADALPAIAAGCAIRTILISVGTNPAPRARIAGQVVELSGLKTRYVDNAVAALRLSSLPTLVWFRGGAPELLKDLGELADRLVLDGEEPLALWKDAFRLRERTDLSDLRWTRLTRWRALMAQFFEMSWVRERAGSFKRLRISGADRIAADLYAAWMTTSLGVPLDLEFHEHQGPSPIDEIRVGEAGEHLSLRLGKSGTCVHTLAAIGGHRSSRAVPLGDQRLAALITEELRIRARDLAFERAVAACVAIP